MHNYISVRIQLLDAVLPELAADWDAAVTGMEGKAPQLGLCFTELG